MNRQQRGGSRAATLVMGCLLLVLAACLVDQDPSIAISTGVPEGRYTVQWETYVAGFAGEATYAQLAFVDKGASSVGAAEPQINELLLLADGREIPATVEAITHDAEHDGAYRLFTALVRVSPLPPGQHTITGIEFSDESRERVGAAVGEWLLDIRPRSGESPLVEGATTVGGTELSAIEATLTNSSDEDVAITGLIVDVPRWSSVTRLATAGRTPAPGSEDEPVAAPELEVVDVVRFGPDQERTVYFELLSDYLQSQQFVTLRPLYSFEIDGVSHLGLLPLQVYFHPFEDDRHIERYLAGLPSEAQVVPGR